MGKKRKPVVLKGCHWKASLFGDGAKGAAFQVYYCVEYPRLTQTWSRENRSDPGTVKLMVDDEVVADLKEAAIALAQ